MMIVRTFFFSVQIAVIVVMAVKVVWLQPQQSTLACCDDGFTVHDAPIVALEDSLRRDLWLTSEKRLVQHGSLLVSEDIDAPFRAASAYLKRDSVMRSILDQVESAQSVIEISKQNCDGDANDGDSFDPAEQRVIWDPLQGMLTSSGGFESPALGLGHELAHVSDFETDPERFSRDDLIADKLYDDKEERRVIEGPETHAALSLGESARSDHFGVPILSLGVSGHRPDLLLSRYFKFRCCFELPTCAQDVDTGFGWSL